MEQYIPKSALVAEIEKRLHANGAFDEVGDEAWSEDVGMCNAYKSILSFLNTFEVKEVDLEKEINNQIRLLGGVHTMGSGVNWYKGPYSELVFFAKHFFELGLNARQNITIDTISIDKIMEENGVDPNSKEANIFKQ